MNILVYRTVRPEEMGYVIDDVIGFFGDNSEITIITRTENVETMKDIKGVDNVIIFDKYSFDVSNIDSTDKKRLKLENNNSNYSAVVIPTSGNLESYNNVVRFNKRLFNCKDVFFHTYPKTFTKLNKSLVSYLKRIISYILALILSIPSLFVYGSYIALLTVFNKIKWLINRNA